MRTTDLATLAEWAALAERGHLADYLTPATLAPAASRADTAARRRAVATRGHRPTDAALRLAWSHLADLADTLATLDALARRVADRPAYRAAGSLGDAAAALATDTLAAHLARWAERAAVVAVLAGRTPDHRAALADAVAEYVTPKGLNRLALNAVRSVALAEQRRPDLPTPTPVADAGPSDAERADADADTLTVADLLALAPASVTRADPFHMGDLTAVALRPGKAGREGRNGWQVAGELAAAVLARRSPVTLASGRTVPGDTLAPVAILRPDRATPTVGMAEWTVSSARAADTCAAREWSALADLLALAAADTTPTPTCGPCGGRGVTRKGAQCQRCQGTGDAPYADTLADLLAVGHYADTLFTQVQCPQCAGEGLTPTGRECGPCEGVGQVTTYRAERLTYVARSGRLRVATLASADHARHLHLATLSALAGVGPSRWGQVDRATSAIRSQVARARAAALPGSTVCALCKGEGTDAEQVRIGAAVASLWGQTVPAARLLVTVCHLCEGSGEGPTDLAIVDPYSPVHTARVTVARAERADAERAALARPNRADRYRGTRRSACAGDVTGSGVGPTPTPSAIATGWAAAVADADLWAERADHLATLRADTGAALAPARAAARSGRAGHLWAERAAGIAVRAAVALRGQEGADAARVRAEQVARDLAERADLMADRAATLWAIDYRVRADHRAAVAACQRHAASALRRPCVTYADHAATGAVDSGGPVVAVALWGQWKGAALADHLADLAAVAAWSAPAAVAERAERARVAGARVTHRAEQVAAARVAARKLAGATRAERATVAEQVRPLPPVNAERAAVVAARVADRVARWGRYVNLAGAAT